jgi:hypothetical protein
MDWVRVMGQTVEPLLPGSLRYALPMRLLGTANGARWHRVCGGVVRVLARATYEARAVQ